MKRLLVLAALLLPACAHQDKPLESAADLQIGKSYPLLNVKPVELKACSVVAMNIATVDPRSGFPMPMLLTAQTEAMVCGEVTCTDPELGSVPYKCVNFEILLSQETIKKMNDEFAKSQSSKSE